MNLALAITWSRICLVPALIVAYAFDRMGICLGLLSWMALSDFLDGRVARARGEVTPRGALLDPVADKSVVIFGFLLAVIDQRTAPWFAILVISRNIAQLMSIPILMMWLKIPFHVRPKLFPKVATGFSFGILIAVVLLRWLQESGRGELAGLLDQALRYGAVPVSAVMEAQILATYLPRLFQISMRWHDTFE